MRHHHNQNEGLEMKLVILILGTAMLAGSGGTLEAANVNDAGLPVSRTLDRPETVCSLNLCFPIAAGPIQVYEATPRYPETLATGTLAEDASIGALVAPRGSRIALSHPSGITFDFTVTL